MNWGRNKNRFTRKKETERKYFSAPSAIGRVISFSPGRVEPVAPVSQTHFYGLHILVELDLRVEIVTP
jgi:hypothetical protein